MAAGFEAQRFCTVASLLSKWFINNLKFAAIGLITVDFTNTKILQFNTILFL